MTTPSQSDPEQLRVWIEAGLQPMGMGDALRVGWVKVEEDHAVFEVTPGAHVYNPLGIVHGGYAAALLDSAVGCAVQSRLADGQGYTTLELKIAYYRPLTSATGPVRAEGRVVAIGERVAFAEGRIIDGCGTLCASATSTLLIFEQRR